ncbi:MAG: hypothetical protein HQL67_05555 [Magnetococcales bacterium]|nr:hypothetical protein [Magnetococcales bacterium]
MSCSINTKKMAELYLQCIAHLSSELRGQAGQRPGAIGRATEALRAELDRACNLGGKRPDVANLDHAEFGPADDFSTLVDVTEITVDTILAHQGTARGKRYKSNEFATALERSYKTRSRELSLDYHTLKSTLDLRTRQLGCLLAAASTMFLTPLELRTVLLSLLTEDLLMQQRHLQTQIQERSILFAEVLINLGLSGDVLARHFAKSTNRMSASDRTKRCQQFQELMTTLKLDSPIFQQEWLLIKQRHRNRHAQPSRQFRDDGRGGWEEQLNAHSSTNGWTAWLPLSPPGKRFPDKRS